MFTGLVAELGVVRSLEGAQDSYRLTIEAKKILKDLAIGDSVAVNGACLTVVAKGENYFTADVMPQTARTTQIGSLHFGERVNLERPLAYGDGMEGHLVTGHIEGVGRILSRMEEGNALIFRITVNKELSRYMVPKGSVAVDGISLTIVEVDENSFTISIIPHTAEMTTLGFKRQGDRVNLETDILAKYIEKLVVKENEFWKNLAITQ